MLSLSKTLICLCLLTSSLWAEKPSFTVGWSVYVGWNPYYYMAKSGILRKWADKYGINIKVQRFDYAPSLDAFVEKNIDACAMTNMEALDMPAAAGIDTTAIIAGDYSNGNDAVMTRGGVTLAQIPGKQVLIVGHGNSLRALRKHIDGIGDRAIVDLEIPTGIPYLYRLADDLSVMEGGYLGDPASADAAAEAVRRQAG